MPDGNPIAGPAWGLKIFGSMKGTALVLLLAVQVAVSRMDNRW